MFQLIEGEPAGAAAKRIGLQLIDENIQFLTTLTPDFDSAVHEARKNCKRLRALLRLVWPELGTRVYRAENECVRDASRQLAPLRDSAVLVLALDNLILTHELAPDSFSAVRAQLEGERQRVRADFLAEPATIAAVIATFQDLRARWEGLPLHDGSFKVFAGGLARTYRQGQMAMSDAVKSQHQAERYHEWRKQVKYLWHQTEILRPIWPDVLGAWERELHQISDYLGDAHDLAELHRIIFEAHAVAYAGLPDTADLEPLLVAEQRRLEAAAWPHGRRLYSEHAADVTGRFGTYFKVWQETGVNGILAIENYVDSKTAATLLGLSVNQVRQRLAAGELPGVKLGGVWLVETP